MSMSASVTAWAWSAVREIVMFIRGASYAAVPGRDVGHGLLATLNGAVSSRVWMSPSDPWAEPNPLLNAPPVDRDMVVNPLPVTVIAGVAEAGRIPRGNANALHTFAVEVLTRVKLLTLT